MPMEPIWPVPKPNHPFQYHAPSSPQPQDLFHHPKGSHQGRCSILQSELVSSPSSRGISLRVLPSLLSLRLFLPPPPRHYQRVQNHRHRRRPSLVQQGQHQILPVFPPGEREVTCFKSSSTVFLITLFSSSNCATCVE